MLLYSGWKNALLTGCLLLAATGAHTLQAEEATLSESVTRHRAIDALVWAMPLLNFKGFRDGHAAVDVGYNDVAYHSKMQNWKFQTATPNDTTPYVNFYWNVADGPVVVEIPPSAEGVGIFGTLMDAWQRPIDDVGAAGRDKGRGGKYLLLPEGYDGPLLPGAYTYRQKTHHGFAILRPIIPEASTEYIDRAAEFARGIRVYPLSQASNPPANKYVDIYDKNVEMTPVLDGGIYAHLHEIIQQEPVEEHNRTMMGMLKRIGIEKGKPFAPDEAMQAVHEVAAPQALEYMIEQYHRRLNPFIYEGRKWSVLAPPGAVETDFSYEFPAYYDYHARGSLYYAIISSVKNYGTATFYLDLAETPDGQWLDGGRNHKLVVPPGVPVRDFWSVVAYDLETAAWIRDMPKVGIDSSRKNLAVNPDGSVDMYFGPEAPQGKEANWIPTAEGRRFFLLFRFYGPKPAVFDGSFRLNDIQRLN